ncbi:DUF4259 domain-containing protein [Nocardia asteroides]|uniref:DUF4259 domain-containing protein n=1 Tax=Nocardia asteroides TaxID=1824 RepID=UPI001E499B7F|nr:DUF4259 domain-containing protein [Nocardia asteroides]UGT64275.1 DUF4259 domain-containing protein [Nocardia asteroides]
MGAWDFGPFDNDHAGDWSARLHHAEPGDRQALLRDALTEAAETTGYLENDEAAAAVAAAAVVASTLPGGTPLTSAYGPTFLTEGGTLDIGEGTPELAVRALERVLGPDSEWVELWAEGGGDTAQHPAFVSVHELLAVLRR